MARLAGIAGSVTIATVSTTGMKNWSIDYKITPLETTAFDSAGTAAYITGISSWNGSFGGFKDALPLTLGATTAAQFKESATAGQLWSGSIIVTGIKPKTDSHGLVSYDYDFQGTGTLTIATA